MPKRTRRGLRGGAVPHLDPRKFKYTEPQNMVNNMSLYTISAHGETTPDKKFLIVPPYTYLVFTAHSGEPALSGIEGTKPYLLYESNETKDDYYNKLYKQLFMPLEIRKEASIPQLQSDLYIYEPGDVIPDYNLFFSNTSRFIFMHGIYKLPIQSISGPDAKRHTDDFGKTKYVMRTLIDDGTIIPEMLDDLDPRDKEDILTASLDELKKGTIIYDARKIKRSYVMDKIENICCREQPENLLFKTPFDKTLIEKQNNILRLSYVLKTLPPEGGKTRRFFFLHFCRVSFDEYLTELKTLFRAASFAGKCPSMEERGSGFNIFRLSSVFCNLPPKLKSDILKTDEGRDFLNTMLKVIERPPGLESWKACVPSKFLNQSYLGYMDAQDLVNIERISILISKMLTNYTKTLAYLKTRIRNTKNNDERGIATKKEHEYSQLKSALSMFFYPIKQFHNQYSRKFNETLEEKRERSKMIQEIYTTLKRKLYPIRLKTEDDPLHFQTTALWLLTAFYESIQTPKYDEDIREIKESIYKIDEYEQHDVVLELEIRFSAFMGDQPIGERIVNLPYLSPNNNLNNTNEIVTVQTNENLRLSGGYRNKTRRRLVTK